MTHADPNTEVTPNATLETTSPAAVATPQPTTEVTTPPAVTPGATATAASPNADALQTELATSLVKMQGLEAQIGALQGTTQEVQNQRQELFTQLTGEIARREGLGQQLATLQGQLEQASQATQTLVNEKNQAEKVAEQATQKAVSAEARAVRLETIAAEFPHLISYATYITASEDPTVVREAAKAFEAVRSSDIDRFRQNLGSVAAMQTVPSGTAPRVPDLAAPTELATYLSGAYSDPQEFERRIAASINNYQARRGS